ncbi:Outer membrane protein B precursor [Poriferisphaera corsica]|uniref:Outer membrane protein B n=1 Tax=Poriferisphaera corsica TaxID=2528020 RepID=A0A517YYV4_9BACT|nr:autotransporter outer membrane beta-barrel domain-containing protein [Poriferisphaera corsica]QDU35396.1 Outer membrane protein B precursor [Poriferisphaera corsica]
MLSHKHYSTAALLAAYTAMVAVPGAQAADLTVDSSTNATVNVATADTITVGGSGDVTITDAVLTPLIQVGDPTGPTAATGITIDQNDSLTFNNTATSGDVVLYDSSVAGNTGFTLDLAAGKTVTYTANGTTGEAKVVAAGDAGVVLALGDGSSIFVSATTGKAYAVVSGQNIDSSATGISGTISATGAAEAVALKAVGTISTGNIGGSVLAVAEDAAVAIQADDAITVGDVAADAVVKGTATGAAGVGAGIAGEGASKKVTVGAVAGTIAGEGVTIAAGISSEGEVEVGEVSGTISAVTTADADLANDGAEAIYGAEAIVVGNLTGEGKITAEAVKVAKAVAGDAAITVGDIAETAKITAVSTDATGKAAAIVTEGNALVTVGAVAGEISATAAGEAAGISSEGGVTVGDVAGTISAKGAKAEGIYAAGAVTTGDITGAVKAEGESYAVGIMSEGALDVTISGEVSATVSEADGGVAAISTVEYKDLGGGTMGWDTANSGANDDVVVLNAGAVVKGDIRLGLGDDTVTLKGYGSYSDEMLDVENLAVDGEAVVIADYATMTAEEKQAAVLAAAVDGNTWKLAKGVNLTKLDVNSGFVKVDGTVAATGAVEIDANAGVVFELKDGVKITADSVTLAQDAFVVAKQGEVLTGDKTYEVVVSTQDIVDNGAVFAIEDTALVDYEVVAADTDPAKKIAIKGTYQGGSAEVVGGGNNVAAFKSFENAVGDAGVAQEITDAMIMLQGMNSKDLKAAVKKLSPEGSLVVAEASSAAAAGFSNQMSSRSAAVGGTSMAAAGSENAYPLMFAGPSLRDENGYEAWTTAFGSKTEQDDNDGMAGFDADVYGSVIGIDRMNENVLAGVALGFATADVDTNGGLGSSELDALSLGAYFAYAPSEWKIEGGMVYSYGEADLERTTLGGTAKADSVESYSLTSYAGASYDFVAQDGKLTLSPSAKLSYTYFNQDGYKEKGAGGFGLNVDSFGKDVVTGIVGMSSAYKVDDQLTLNGLVALKYDFVNEAAEVDAVLLAPGATSFSSKGIETDKTAIELGGGFDWKLNDKMKASCDYTYEHRDSADTQSLTVGFNLLF